MGMQEITMDTFTIHNPRDLVEEIGETCKLLENYKLALDKHAIVAVTDTAGKIVYVNKLFCELSKYSNDELIGQNHSILNSGHHPKEFFQLMWKTIATGEDWRGVICNKAKDGSHYWVKTSIFPFKNLGGKIMGYTAVRTDVTEQIETQRQLQAARQMLEAEQTAIKSKNMALSELLNHLDEEKKKVLKTIKTNFEIAVFPLLDQLSQHAPAQATYYELIKKNLEDIADPILSKVRDTAAKLTPKELQICSMIKQGMTVKEIAALMHLSSRTVDKHRENIRKKLGITDRQTNLGSYLISHLK